MSCARKFDLEKTQLYMCTINVYRTKISKVKRDQMTNLFVGTFNFIPGIDRLKIVNVY